MKIMQICPNCERSGNKKCRKCQGTGFIIMGYIEELEEELHKILKEVSSIIPASSKKEVKSIVTESLSSKALAAFFKRFKKDGQ